MADVRNILVGAAQIFVSRGTGAYRPITKPGTSQATGNALTGLANAVGDVNFTAQQSAKSYLGQSTNWRDVGYTNTGLEVSYEPGYNDVMVDQLLDAARLFKSTLKVMLKTELAEGTLENLQLVFGQSETPTTYNQAGAPSYPKVLDYNDGTSIDPAKVTLGSGGTTASTLTGTTIIPAIGSTGTITVTASAAPTYNVTRNSSGSVIAVTQVYGGSGFTAGAASGTIVIQGAAQKYFGGTGTTGSANQDITLNLAASFTGGQTATLSLAAGALGDAPVERSIVAVGQAPVQFGETADPSNDPNNQFVPGKNDVTTSLKERVYVARRVVQIESSSHGLKRDSATVFPVQFRCLPDDNDLYDGAEYGVIIDRVFTAY
jgi:hypothetical protein